MTFIPRERIAVKAERTGNRQMDKIQSNMSESVRELNNNPFIHGALATDQTTGETTITFTKGVARTLNHHLGRVPTGAFVVACDNPAETPELGNPPHVGVPGITAKDSKTMTYRLPVSCTASIWVW